MVSRTTKASSTGAPQPEVTTCLYAKLGQDGVVELSAEEDCAVAVPPGLVCTSTQVLGEKSRRERGSPRARRLEMWIVSDIWHVSIKRNVTGDSTVEVKLVILFLRGECKYLYSDGKDGNFLECSD